MFVVFVKIYPQNCNSVYVCQHLHTYTWKVREGGDKGEREQNAKICTIFLGRNLTNLVTV